MVYNEREIRLPNDTVLVEDIACLFQLRSIGLHLKYRANGVWKSVKPDSRGIFDLPEEANNFIVIGIDESFTKASSSASRNEPQSSLLPPLQSTTSNLCLGQRRGNSALLSSLDIPPMSFGTRAVPAFKRRLTLPVFGNKKKTLAKPVMKMFNICDVEDENMVNVFEVPIDLVKMKTVMKDFTVDDIQNEICNLLMRVYTMLEN